MNPSNWKEEHVSQRIAERPVNTPVRDRLSLSPDPTHNICFARVTFLRYTHFGSASKGESHADISLSNPPPHSPPSNFV
jgi:hypothetical protein